MNKSKPETAIFIAHDDFVGRDSAEAERNLMRAVLQCAMDDYRKRGEPFRDAKRFFTARDDFYLYSFNSICSHLNLCPRTVRSLLGISENAELHAPEFDGVTPGEPAEEADDKVAA